MTQRYQVTVTRDSEFWFVRVDGVGATQARHLAEVDQMARDLIVTMEGTTAESVELDVTRRLPAGVEARLARAAKLREQSATANSRAAEEVRAAARALRDEGITLRDVGEVLGVSYQRAHQLAS